MTEWHQRYGPGVMIYWHVERKSVCVYSQLTTCSALEPAAMMCSPALASGIERDEWANWRVAPCLWSGSRTWLCI